MQPSPLDEYPVHQSTLSLGRVATSDTRFYDRAYYNGFDQDTGTFFVAGLGVYPHLGVTDGFLLVRRGDELRSRCASDEVATRRLEQAVGPLRIEVLEPLQTLRVVCEDPGSDLEADLTWHSSFPAVFEPPQVVLSDDLHAHHPTYDTNRFGQVGRWSGSLRVGSATLTPTPATWIGFRDRSWGVRPLATPTPRGEVPRMWAGGFWWSYVPVQFDDSFVMVVASERPDGERRMNQAVRVRRDGSVENLGWPRFHVDYRPGTRQPLGARIELTGSRGEPLVVELEVVGSVPLGLGSGYVTDWEWVHGMQMGRDWSRSRTFNLSDPETAVLAGIGVTDHAIRARLGDQVGWGMFEHACLGRHDPSGFTA